MSQRTVAAHHRVPNQHKTRWHPMRQPPLESLRRRTKMASLSCNQREEHVRRKSPSLTNSSRSKTHHHCINQSTNEHKDFEHECT